MGCYIGGEFIQDSRELEPADDAGICYDAECAGGDDEFCDNCGKYIGLFEYRQNGGLCDQCYAGIL